MTENEIKKTVAILEVNKLLSHRQTEFVEAADIAIQALEEIQQYRAIGTIEDINKTLNLGLKAQVELMNYQKIGTVEEFKDLKEKSVAKKPTEKELPYSEEVGLNSEWHCPACGSYVGYFTEGMNEPEQMEYCNVCGQHIARDWSE